jgi:hypothetical protein
MLAPSAVDKTGSHDSGCDQGEVSQLASYQQELMRDYSDGTSALGRVCWDTKEGAADPLAQSLFILGVKSLSNFMYDYCQVVFDELVRRRPDFVLGYWGRAMCNAQLIWSTERPVESGQLLAKGMAKAGYASLDPVSSAIFNASVALNQWDAAYPACPSSVAAPSSAQGLTDSRLCRYEAFFRLVADALAVHPDNDNAGAYYILGALAVATVKCSSTAPGQCHYTQDARSQASRMYAAGALSPAFLHYGLHSHDFPYEEIYDSGLEFAVAYPSKVNTTCHSLHMPAHLWDRAGVFSKAQLANAASVKGADTFSSEGFGALSSVGGDVGTEGWAPGCALTAQWPKQLCPQ